MFLLVQKISEAMISFQSLVNSQNRLMDMPMIDGENGFDSMQSRFNYIHLCWRMIINNADFGCTEYTDMHWRWYQGLVVPTQAISVNDLYFSDRFLLIKWNFRKKIWRISEKNCFE